MLFGIIFKNYAIIELKNNRIIFYKNWENHLNSKDVSIKCVISSSDYFLKKLKEIKAQNWQNNFIINKLIWKLENPIKYQLGYYPKVSIIISAFNAEKTIKKSIKSILKQTYSNIELILIDDCSEDTTFSIMELYKDRCMIIRNKENRGVYYNRNQALKIATGEIIGIQDADDISDLERIFKSVNYLIKNDVIFILTNSKKIDKILDDISSIKVAMASFVCNRVFFDEYGVFDENTRHSGDLEILDRAYFLRFGEYRFKNFWYWLNYTTLEKNFYGHIYETLYYIGTPENSITKKNKIHKRQKYLNERRKYFINKK